MAVVLYHAGTTTLRHEEDTGSEEVLAFLLQTISFLPRKMAQYVK